MFSGVIGDPALTSVPFAILKTVFFDVLFSTRLLSVCFRQKEWHILRDQRMKLAVSTCSEALPDALPVDFH